MSLKNTTPTPTKSISPDAYLIPPNTFECSQCHQLFLDQRVCPTCSLLTQPYNPVIHGLPTEDDLEAILEDELMRILQGSDIELSTISIDKALA